MAGLRNNSMETILTFENRDISQWSAMWSTNHVTTAGGAHPGWHNVGRRRMRIAALSLGAFLTMHCKVTAAALTGGYIIFVIFLIVAVVALANPLRHFEVYLGQWSISGPGRAFRILPMFDGLGIAMCINALVRAITCCVIAAITGTYLMHSVSDETLPFTYCRNFQLKPYDPVLKNIQRSLYQIGDTPTNPLNKILTKDWRKYETFQLRKQNSVSTTVGFKPFAWRNISSLDKGSTIELSQRQVQFCNETFTGLYPALYDTPAYNYFYVELVHLRTGFSLKSFNSPMIYSLITIWVILWMALIFERILNHRLTWNRLYLWFIIVPVIWGIVLIVSAFAHLSVMQYKIKYAFRVSAKEMFESVADALDVALYIHASALGTELIYGKGLNVYASGHIDPHLNGENVWHSIILTLLAALHSGGATACAFVDYLQLDINHRIQDMRESTLWVIPMYSKCVTEGTRKYLRSTLVFGGLTLSYMVVAYIMIKTALHIIFEYKVKFVYLEQVVVACIIIPCMGISIMFATNGGIVLLESIDATMTGVATPMIVLLELAAMLVVYRGRDFESDMDLSMEENACSSRIGTQWHIIPFIAFGTMAVKLYTVINSEFPRDMLLFSMIPVVIVILAMLMRAIHNAYVFFQK